MDIRLARHTSPEALERAAVFLESVPGLARVFGSGFDPQELRAAIAFELAYGNVRDAARHIAINLDHAILRRKLKAVRITRALYKIAKSYASIDFREEITPHVDLMKQTLVRPRRRK